MPKTLVLTVKAIGPSARGTQFVATVDGRGLTRSHQPFLDAARVLLAEGTDADTVLVMRHEGTNRDALRGRLGDLAGLTVSEPGSGKQAPDFRPWVPFDRGDLAPRDGLQDNCGRPEDASDD
jgi:hypothetical protein